MYYVSVPHVAEFSLNVEQTSLLPGIDKPQTVGMSRQSFVSLHLRQSVPPAVTVTHTRIASPTKNNT